VCQVCLEHVGDRSEFSAAFGTVVVEAKDSLDRVLVLLKVCRSFHSLTQLILICGRHIAHGGPVVQPITHETLFPIDGAVNGR
jgi:hypothetical protein